MRYAHMLGILMAVLITMGGAVASGQARQLDELAGAAMGFGSGQVILSEPPPQPGRA